MLTAVVVDLVDVLFERSPWLQAATTTLYVAGAVSTVVAYLTGTQAGATVLVPGMAYPILTAHGQWALATMSWCIVVAVLRCWRCCVAMVHAADVAAWCCSASASSLWC